jgi:hypothetical protein
MLRIFMHRDNNETSVVVGLRSVWVHPGCEQARFKTPLPGYLVSAGPAPACIVIRAPAYAERFLDQGTRW